MASHRRPGPGVARRAVTAGGALVAASAVGVVPLSATFATVADAAPVAPIDWPQATTVAAEAWSLDVPPTFELAGLTGPAPLALVRTPPPRLVAGTAGLDRPYPIDFDHVAAWRASAERRANEEALRASAGAQDDQKLIEERMKCDPRYPQPDVKIWCEEK